MPSWLRPTEDSPAGPRNSLLFRPQTDKQLGPSVDHGYSDMLSLGKNHPGQMPKPKRPNPAGLSRSQVQTDGKDLSRGYREVEARAVAVVNIQGEKMAGLKCIKMLIWSTFMGVFTAYLLLLGFLYFL